MKEKEILEKAYKKAYQIVTKKEVNLFSTIICEDIDVLIENIEQNKSIVSALATSLVKKIIDPQQDIRYSTNQTIKRNRHYCQRHHNHPQILSTFD